MYGAVINREHIFFSNLESKDVKIFIKHCKAMIKGPFILFKGRQIGLKADHKESFDDYVESRMVKLCKYGETEPPAPPRFHLSHILCMTIHRKNDSH